MTTTIPMERRPDAELEDRLRDLGQRPSRSPEAAAEERAIWNELHTRRLARERRERRELETRRPPDPVAPAEDAPDPSSPEGQRLELERERARLALEHERSPDAEVLKQLRRVEAELAEADRVIERRAIAEREGTRVAKEEAKQREVDEHQQAQARAVRLRRKRVRLAAKIERTTDELVALIREDEVLRDRLAGVTGGFIDKGPLVAWLQGRLNEPFPMDFPMVHDHYRGRLAELLQ